MVCAVIGAANRQEREKERDVKGFLGEHRVLQDSWSKERSEKKFGGELTESAQT